MRQDLRPYFQEIITDVNSGLSRRSYTEDEILYYTSQLDTFYCMGQCARYLLSFSSNRFLYISDNFQDVIGIPVKEVMNTSIVDFIGRIFVAEQGIIATGLYKRTMEALIDRYKNRCDIQMYIDIGFYHNATHERRRLLMQRQPLLWDPESGLELLGGVLQDITYLKEEGKPFASITCKGEVLEFFEQDEAVAPPSLAGFSKREMDILRFTEMGMSIKEVAEATGLSKATVYSHRRNIMAKSEVNNMNQVIDLLKLKGVI